MIAIDLATYCILLLLLVVVLQVVILMLIIIDRGAKLPDHIDKMLRELDQDEIELLINYGQRPSTFPKTESQSDQASKPTKL